MGEAPNGFYGGFATAEFPRPLPFVEKLSAGTTVEYIKYKRKAGYESLDEDALFFDVHGKYAAFKFLDSSIGFEALKNRDRSSDFRGYLQVGVTIGYK